MFTGTRDGEVVAGGIANRAENVVGLSNVFTEVGEPFPFGPTSRR